MYYTLDLIENISDHMPLYVKIDNHTPMISGTVDTCLTPRVKAYRSEESVDNINNLLIYFRLYICTS